MATTKWLVQVLNAATGRWKRWEEYQTRAVARGVSSSLNARHGKGNFRTVRWRDGKVAPYKRVAA